MAHLNSMNEERLILNNSKTMQKIAVWQKSGKEDATKILKNPSTITKYMKN